MPIIADNKKNSLVEVTSGDVLSEIVNNHYKIYAFRVSKGTCVNLNEKTVSQIEEFTKDKDFLFFRVEGDK